MLSAVEAQRLESMIGGLIEVLGDADWGDDLTAFRRLKAEPS